MSYQVPNRGVPYTVIASRPINENWDEIQRALNEISENSSQVPSKIDKAAIGSANGVAGLDNRAKVVVSQLPDIAVTTSTKVNSLAEQLALSATKGDVCVRTDIGKTYILLNNTPSQFTNWLEIASVNAGGDIGSNPCYTNDIAITDWVQIADGTFHIQFADTEHGQGTTKYLFVNVQKSTGETINLDYDVSDDGIVDLKSDFAFDCKLIISNLSGNVKSSKYTTYSILDGPVDSFGELSLISRSLHAINLNCSSPVHVIDGMDILREITSSTETPVQNIEDGDYVIFIDSKNITNKHLSKLSFTSKQKYLGVLNSLPSTGTKGERCYIAYHKSYEWLNDNWVPTAFVPIGEFSQRQGEILDSRTYNLRDNHIDVTKYSHVLDYLFGSKIQGLTIDIGTDLIVYNGKCLCGNKLVEVESMSKALSTWTIGDEGGCFADDVNSNNGWGYIYLINSGRMTDILLTFNETPSLPEGYGFEGYRRIGYFYKDGNTVRKQKTVNNKIYFLTPQTNLTLPQGTNGIYDIVCSTEQTITFKIDDIIIQKESIKEKTLELPSEVNIVGNATKTLLGYVDLRIES